MALQRHKKYISPQKSTKKSWGELTEEERLAKIERDKEKKERKKKFIKEVSGYQEVPLSHKDIIMDYNYLGRLPICKAQKDWIEHTMYELREKANKYEKAVYKALKDKGVEFIHQAPFVLDGQIFFADFYIPALRVLIEVDGSSHENVRNQRKDYLRDDAFASYKMETHRIQNSVAADKNKLEEALTIILFNRKKSKQ